MTQGINNSFAQRKSSSPYIRLHDSKSANTAGGTFTSGAWQKRTVTEDQDASNLVAVASSVITLQPGTYDCLITCPAHAVEWHKARLRNTTDGVTTIVGTSAKNGINLNSTYTQNESTMRSRFTITAAKNFEIQHRCTSTTATNGFGMPTNVGEVEIYTIAEFWKIIELNF
jgi:hypothetical protein